MRRVRMSPGQFFLTVAADRTNVLKCRVRSVIRLALVLARRVFLVHNRWVVLTMSGPFVALSEPSSLEDTHTHAETVPLAIHVVNFFMVATPLAALIGATWLLWGVGFGWTQFIVLAVMYVINGLGITVGYHRLFTHKSFECGPVTRFVIGVLGSMAIEGPLFKWVATHRQHHQHSDRDDDPHSPHQHGKGLRGLILGAWHAHVGWIFVPDAPNLNRYVVDLRADPVLRVVDRYFIVWALLGLAIPTVIGGLVEGSWTGALLGFLWGGVVRIFLLHHVTWSINSVCHLWGSRPFSTHDESRDNPVFGVLAFGEGWHNAHHAFPTSARHGLAWWKLDINYLVIRGLELLHLARNVRLPDAERIAAKRR